MNVVVLSGNVTQVYDNRSYTKFIIADNRADGYTNYIPVCVFDQQKDFVDKYVKIGDHVSVYGYVSVYRDGDTQRISINASRVNFEGYRNPKKPAGQQFSQETAEQLFGFTQLSD